MEKDKREKKISLQKLIWITKRHFKKIFYVNKVYNPLEMMKKLYYNNQFKLSINNNNHKYKIKKSIIHLYYKVNRNIILINSNNKISFNNKETNMWNLNKILVIFGINFLP